jgi:hypothetical protein
VILVGALTVSTAAVATTAMLGAFFMGNLGSLPKYMEEVTIRTCSSVNAWLVGSPIRSRQVDAIEAFLAFPD